MRNALITLALFGSLLCAPAALAEIDWSRVDAAMGRDGVMIGTAHRYELPRRDLRTRLDGVELAPGLVGGWVAFQQIGRYAMMRGDLVVAEVEAPRAVTRLLAQGVRISGVHHHLLRARPEGAHLHVAGYGDPVELAQALRGAVPIKAADLADPSPDLTPPELAQIEASLGAKARMTSGARQFLIPRAEEVRASGAPAPAALGAASALNFQALGDGKAAITAEFAALASEVKPLVETLHAGGLEVAGLCDHMQDDQPRLTFVHVFAQGDAVQLAYALKRGLDVLGGDSALIPPAPAPARALSWR
ncbi:DUF1259 domain-containing protein [Methylocystis echinoides]|uniref:DUF1259 domain-containing protein n=1 Tax=Methylocystis echinoides TaxID=29468 RepID=UPI003447D853